MLWSNFRKAPTAWEFWYCPIFRKRNSVSKKIMPIFVIFIFISYSIKAFSLPMHNLEGEWEVQGVDRGGEWSGTMYITEQEAAGSLYRVRGYFEWIGENGQYGTEHFRGSYTEDEMFSAQGYELEDHFGIGTGKYKALVAPNGEKLIEGTWSGGGMWSAIK